MEASKVLNKQIFIEVLVAFIFLGVILIGGYTLYTSIKGKNVLKDGDLILDVVSTDAPTNLYIMGDSAGLSTKPYIVNVTNNSKKKVNYKLSLKNNIASGIKIEDYLRIAIDNTNIKTLSDFSIDKNGNFIIFEKELEKGMTDSHTIKIWFAANSPNTLGGLEAKINFLVSGE